MGHRTHTSSPMEAVTATLLDCSERFCGEYNAERVNHFVDYIEAYRRIKQIGPQQALFELPHLLTENARTWWRSRCAAICNWYEALTTVRRHFSLVHPAHLVYQEIFSKPFASQKTGHQLLQLLTEKVLLFNQLPELAQTSVSVMHLDMLYALLPAEVQEQVKRCDLLTMAQLLERVQQLETTKDERQRQEDSSKNQATLELNNNDASLSNGNQSADDCEPLIKVRRTADLMPLRRPLQAIQQDDGSVTVLDLRTETVAPPVADQKAQSDQTKPTLASYHIDNSELMNQINSIIDNCTIDVEPPVPNATVLALQTDEVQASNGSDQLPALPQCDITIAFVPNASDGPDGHTKFAITTKMQAMEPTQSPPKRRLSRCKLCRSFRHSQQECNKRTRRKNSKPEIPAIPALPPPSPPPAPPPPPPLPPAALPIIENNPQPTIIVTASTSKPTELLSTAIASSSSSKSTEGIGSTAMTTKLILPTEVPPSSGKCGAAAKLKANDRLLGCNPSAKCHQCGTVGYYRSICPNCSPIYFYKPHNSCNR